ncbi:MAG: hypothetical protein DWQ08_01215 [Proteobacteria bacterium]|nr:MAG: hypothetical protein DWQ08_01215 [Pseudomonadota bacterium]
MKTPVLGALAAASLGTGTGVLASGSPWEDYRPVVFPVCYDFTCKTREVVRLSRTQWNSVAELFRYAPQSPHEERIAIQKAVGRMEQVTGFHTPTHRDLSRNYTGEDDALAGLSGQMDCVDESLNTTTYLEIFEQRGLLTHHRVVDRAYRRALLNQHWAGQVEEIASGERYVVDSWFFDNGQLPYVLHSDEWHDISPFRRARRSDQRGDRDARVAANRGR